METIGSILKARRIEKGINIKTLSTLTGISVVMISKYENSKYLPSAKMLGKLCNVLELDYDALYEKLMSEKE